MDVVCRRSLCVSVCVYLHVYLFLMLSIRFAFSFLSSVFLLFVSLFCFAMVCLSFYWFICLLKKEGVELDGWKEERLW